MLPSPTCLNQGNIWRSSVLSIKSASVSSKQIGMESREPLVAASPDIRVNPNLIPLLPVLLMRDILGFISSSLLYGFSFLLLQCRQTQSPKAIYGMLASCSLFSRSCTLDVKLNLQCVQWCWWCCMHDTLNVTSQRGVLRCWQARSIGYRGVLNRCRECMQLLRDDMIDRLQTFVGPAEAAADALRVCPMASGFGFADLVIIISNNNNACTKSGTCMLAPALFCRSAAVPGHR